MDHGIPHDLDGKATPRVSQLITRDMVYQSEQTTRPGKRYVGVVSAFRQEVGCRGWLLLHALVRTGPNDEMKATLMGST